MKKKIKNLTSEIKKFYKKIKLLKVVNIDNCIYM